MMKKKIIILLLCASLIMSLTSCSSKNEQPKEQQQTLSIAVARPWEGTDIYQCLSTCFTTTLIADGLLTFDKNTKELIPSIAEDFNVSEDGKTITLTIPEGLKYGNGETLTPDDVKSSIEWGLKVSAYSGDYAAIKEIAIEGNNVILKLSDFSATVLYYLTSYYMPVIDKDQIDKTVKEELLMEAMPYGPFYVTEYEQDSFVKVKRNEYYKTNSTNFKNTGKSNLSEAEVKIVPDAFNRISLLKAGEVDVCFDIPIENVEELEKDPNIDIIKYTPPGFNYLALNKDNPIFNDPIVRKAMALALDRELLAERDKSVTPLYSYVTPEMTDYSPDTEEYYKANFGTDKAKAKELLAQAGWTDSDGDGILDKNGKKFEFTLTGNAEDTSAKNLMQIIQADLKQLGISVKIETIERRYLVEKMGKDDYDSVLYYYYWAESFTSLPYLFFRDPNNLENQDYYDILAEGVKKVNQDDRKEALTKAQRILVDEGALIPVFKKNAYIAYNKKVSGITLLHDGIVKFNDVAIEQ